MFVAGRGDLRAHRAAYECFVGPIPDGLSVLHSCDNPPCILPWHLHLGTQADNNKECRQRGRAATRERHGRTHLTWADVDAIRRAVADGESQKSVASRYGVVGGTVHFIVRRVTWAS